MTGAGAGVGAFFCCFLERRDELVGLVAVNLPFNSLCVNPIDQRASRKSNCRQLAAAQSAHESGCVRRRTKLVRTPCASVLRCWVEAGLFGCARPGGAGRNPRPSRGRARVWTSGPTNHPWDYLLEDATAASRTVNPWSLDMWAIRRSGRCRLGEHQRGPHDRVRSPHSH